MTTKYRRNAVVVDFNVMPSRPDMESVSRFISKGLKLDMTRTKNLQFNNSRNHVIIELGSPEEASELADRHNLKHTWTFDDHRFAVPMYVEDDAIQVRVHDLPPHMPNDLIIAHLEAYGEVKSIRNEVWREYFPGIPNGVRAVRMVLKKPIPSFIIVEEEMAYIHYPNQQKTCRHCCKPLHNGKKCNESRPSKTTPTPKAPTPKAPTAPSKTNPTDITTTKTTNTATINSTITNIATKASTNNNNNQPKQQTEIVPQKTISSSASEGEENETIEDESHNDTAPATTTTTTSDHEQRTEQTKRTRPKRKRRIRNPYDPRYYEQDCTQKSPHDNVA